MQQNAFAHMPQPTLKETARLEYAPYRAVANPELAGVLERVRVHSVLAISYRATAQWRINRRTANDRLFFITGGRGELEIAGRKSTFGAGDCLHIRRGVWHCATTDAREPVRFMALHYTATVFESLLLPELLPLPEVMRLGAGSPVAAMLEEACREYALRPPGWENGLQAGALQILLFLIRECGTQDGATLQTQQWAQLQRLLPAIKAMRANLSKPLPMRELAALCNLSEVQFRRVFEAALGVTPVQYLRRIRMEEACLLLQETNETIEQIAARVGYAEAAYFSHSFKQLIGISPGRYRATATL